MAVKRKIVARKTKAKKSGKKTPSRSRSAKPASSSAAEIRAYMAKLPAASRKVMAKVRATVRAEAPGATDYFSYRIPALQFEGKTLVWYAAWRHHVSMYPLGERITKKTGVETIGYKTAKGTIQFPLDEPLPVELIRKLVRARIAQMQK